MPSRTVAIGPRPSPLSTTGEGVRCRSLDLVIGAGAPTLLATLLLAAHTPLGVLCTHLAAEPVMTRSELIQAALVPPKLGRRSGRSVELLSALLALLPPRCLVNKSSNIVFRFLSSVWSNSGSTSIFSAWASSPGTARPASPVFGATNGSVGRPLCSRYESGLGEAANADGRASFDALSACLTLGGTRKETDLPLSADSMPDAAPVEMGEPRPELKCASPLSTETARRATRVCADVCKMGSEAACNGFSSNTDETGEALRESASSCCWRSRRKASTMASTMMYVPVRPIPAEPAVSQPIRR